MKKILYVIFILLLVACSDKIVGQADSWGKLYKPGEIVNVLDENVQIEFKWAYEEVEDSMQISIEKGKTLYFSDSLTMGVPLFIEGFLEHYPDATFDASIEFESSSLKCLTFTGPVKDEKNDPRSEFTYEEIDPTIVEGLSLKRLVIDSTWLEQAETCE
ncbi:MAG TPA: hypothetical protein GX707_09755 [Epulopiscium sp.]|nr:hypothetical protein [Candidatus Epulonipiscium sp.]